MSELHSSLQEPLPAEMYIGGFKRSAEAVSLALEYAGVSLPAVLYYPGSSTDASLTDIEGIYTIHSDSNFSDAGLRGFAALGSEAHRADAHTWEPPQPVDAIVFINPTGIDELQVVQAARLREDGVILWAGGQPEELQSDPSVGLIGVITYSDDRELAVDDTNLDDYFARKRYADLTEEEVTDFGERLQRYLTNNGLESAQPIDEVYDLLLHPDNANLVFEININLPYIKSGTFFVYRKLAEADTVSNP